VAKCRGNRLFKKRGRKGGAGKKRNIRLRNMGRRVLQETFGDLKTSPTFPLKHREVLKVRDGTGRVVEEIEIISPHIKKGKKGDPDMQRADICITHFG